MEIAMTVHNPEFFYFPISFTQNIPTKPNYMFGKGDISYLEVQSK